MSDPVTNVEIEDVLSSIRRLVSDGERARVRDSHMPTPESVTREDVEQVERDVVLTALDNGPAIPTSDGQDDVVAAQPADRLVLTPALRVSEAVDPPDETETSCMTEDADGIASGEASDADSDETAQTLTQPVEASVSEEADVADLDDAVLALSDEGAAQEWVDSGEPETQAAMPGREDLVATIEELEAAVDAAVQDFEPDGSEAVSGNSVWPLRPTSAPEPHSKPVYYTGEVEGLVSSDEPGADDVQSDVDMTPEPEQPISADDMDAEFEGTFDDDFDDDAPEGFGKVDFDDVALRALVSDVVREELSGPLGERITRNVRKLVRREIYRILSSQDFD